MRLSTHFLWSLWSCVQILPPSGMSYVTQEKALNPPNSHFLISNCTHVWGTEEPWHMLDILASATSYFNQGK